MSNNVCYQNILLIKLMNWKGGGQKNKSNSKVQLIHLHHWILYFCFLSLYFQSVVYSSKGNKFNHQRVIQTAFSQVSFSLTSMQHLTMSTNRYFLSSLVPKCRNYMTFLYSLVLSDFALSYTIFSLFPFILPQQFSNAKLHFHLSVRFSLLQ